MVHLIDPSWNLSAYDDYRNENPVASIEQKQLTQAARSVKAERALEVVQFISAQLMPEAIA